MTSISQFADQLKMDLIRSEDVDCGPSTSAFHDCDAARSWEDAVDDLLRIRKLPDNWDGEGSEPPSAEVVDSAITLSQTLQKHNWLPPERVIASVNGTIYFEWHVGDSYHEIELTAPDYAELRIVPAGDGKTRNCEVERATTLDINLLLKSRIVV